MIHESLKAILPLKKDFYCAIKIHLQGKFWILLLVTISEYYFYRRIFLWITNIYGRDLVGICLYLGFYFLWFLRKNNFDVVLEVSISKKNFQEVSIDQKNFYLDKFNLKLLVVFYFAIRNSEILFFRSNLSWN